MQERANASMSSLVPDRDTGPRPFVTIPGVTTRETAHAGGRRTPALDCIAVRSRERIAIVRVQAIVRLEADDNYVRIWADRMYLHKETLAGLCERLDSRQFVRIHRSHALRVDCVKELVPQLHGEYLVRLSNGVEILSGRSYRSTIRSAFGLN